MLQKDTDPEPPITDTDPKPPITDIDAEPPNTDTESPTTDTDPKPPITDTDTEIPTPFPSAEYVKPAEMTSYIINDFDPWLQEQRDKGLI